MIGTHAATRYQQSSVNTISREKLLIMLFDGAIGYARVSKMKLDAGDQAGFREYLGKCQAIVMEFLNTLNMKEGGNIAVNLQQIYLFLIDHTNEANVSLLGKNMEDTARILGHLREGFDGAIRSLARISPQGS
ncbi:MAG: flagellar export chaperone FliS [Deltaproteobacteria bacterium]|nr:flagellar export chaperone FliS [Deltaproteobacteria bacterium]